MQVELSLKFRDVGRKENVAMLIPPYEYLLVGPDSGGKNGMARMRMLQKGWENLNPVVWRRFVLGRIVLALGLCHVGVG